MKHLRYILTAALAISLALSACTASVQNDGTDSAIQPTAQPEEIVEPASDSNLAYTTGSNGAHIATGYYSLQYNDDWTTYLAYSDYATAQTVALCNQPNCTHDNESCLAWFEDPYNIPRIATNGEKLVYYYLGANNIGGSSGEEFSIEASIEIADLDGGNRQTICSLESNETLYEGVCINLDTLYVMVTTTALNSDGTVSVEQSVIGVDIITGTQEKLWSAKQENGTIYFLVGCLDNCLVIKKIQAQTISEDNYLEQVKSQVHTLYLLSPTKHTIEELCSWQQDEALELASASNFYLVNANNQLCGLKSDGTMTVLAEDEIFSPGENYLEYVDGSSLWLTSTVRPSQSNPAPLYKVDLNAGTISEVICDGNISVLGKYNNELFVEVSPDTSIQNIQQSFLAMLPENALYSKDLNSILTERQFAAID